MGRRIWEDEWNEMGRGKGGVIWWWRVVLCGGVLCGVVCSGEWSGVVRGGGGVGGRVCGVEEGRRRARSRGVTMIVIGFGSGFVRDWCWWIAGHRHGAPKCNKQMSVDVLNLCTHIFITLLHLIV